MAPPSWNMEAAAHSCGGDVSFQCSPLRPPRTWSSLGVGGQTSRDISRTGLPRMCAAGCSLESSSGREAMRAAAQTHAVPPCQPETPPEREAPADWRGEQQHAPAAAPGGSSITPRTGAHGRCGATRL
ncbi:hypothetical protein VPH35_051418 [Triticum aestivum]